MPLQKQFPVVNFQEFSEFIIACQIKEKFTSQICIKCFTFWESYHVAWKGNWDFFFNCELDCERKESDFLSRDFHNFSSLLRSVSVALEEWTRRKKISKILQKKFLLKSVTQLLKAWKIIVSLLFLCEQPCWWKRPW